jgi:hypothetical protein
MNYYQALQVLNSTNNIHSSGTHYSIFEPLSVESRKLFLDTAFASMVTTYFTDIGIDVNEKDILHEIKKIKKDTVNDSDTFEINDKKSGTQEEKDAIVVNNEDAAEVNNEKDATEKDEQNAEKIFADLCKDVESYNIAIEEYRKVKRELNALEEEKREQFDQRKKRREAYLLENKKLKAINRDLLMENAFLKQKKKDEEMANIDKRKTKKQNKKIILWISF